MPRDDSLKSKKAKAAYMKQYWSVRDKAAYARRRRVRLRAVVRAAKKQPCDMCGDNFPPICMDFHHRNSGTKSFQIGTRFANHSAEVLLKEIDKCDVLCANCHRIITHRNRKNRRGF